MKTKAKAGELIKKRIKRGTSLNLTYRVALAAVKDFKRCRENTTSCNQDHIVYCISIFKGITEALLL